MAIQYLRSCATFNALDIFQTSQNSHRFSHPCCTIVNSIQEMNAPSVVYHLILSLSQDNSTSCIPYPLVKIMDGYILLKPLNFTCGTPYA